jgi:hypothetical protein
VPNSGTGRPSNVSFPVHSAAMENEVESEEEL